jgi:hypothetical protein
VENPDSFRALPTEECTNPNRKEQVMSKGMQLLKGMQQAMQNAAHSPGMAPVWGFLNQGRMELANVAGKAFPDTPQFDDPAAAFNRTPLEGYQLKQGIQPGKSLDMDMGR